MADSGRRSYVIDRTFTLIFKSEYGQPTPQRVIGLFGESHRFLLSVAGCRNEKGAALLATLSPNPLVAGVGFEPTTWPPTSGIGLCVIIN